MMSLTFGLFTQVSDLGLHGPLVSGQKLEEKKNSNSARQYAHSHTAMGVSCREIVLHAQILS